MKNTKNKIDNEKPPCFLFPFISDSDIEFIESQTDYEIENEARKKKTEYDKVGGGCCTDSVKSYNVLGIRWTVIKINC